MFINILICLSIFVHTSISTTEWFGDLRAQLNPPRAPAFYDVTYDDSECPQGLQSNAIPDYVYFGAMIATMTVTEHSECLEHCISNPKCNAVNFFEPMSYQEKGFCELLTETQVDNPRLMRPFRKAVYYEKIRCRTEEDETDTPSSPSSNPSRVETESKMSIRTPEARKTKSIQEDKQSTSSTTIEPVSSSSVRSDKSSSKSSESSSVISLPVVSQFTDDDNKKMDTIMKQLAEKVHEFNLRFRSRR